MTTRTPVQASPPATSPVDVELDLDSRMALTLAVMDERCSIAALAVDINSAHIAVDPLPEITIPPLPQTAIPAPYTTPIAALLHRARIRIQTDGWCRDALYDEAGAICPIRAIRLEAASRYQADDACVLLLDAIQRDFTDDTIPSWNRRQTSVAPALLYLGRAADFAHSRSI